MSAEAAALNEGLENIEKLEAQSSIDEIFRNPKIFKEKKNSRVEILKFY